MFGVIARSQEMQRDVGFIAHNPAVVPRLNVEDVACVHLNDSAIIHSRSSAAGNDHPDVLNRATLLAGGFAYVN
jgi:ABC-type phosphate/phosphonate transport system ATPase subunit